MEQQHDAAEQCHHWGLEQDGAEAGTGRVRRRACNGGHLNGGEHEAECSGCAEEEAGLGLFFELLVDGVGAVDDEGSGRCGPSDAVHGRQEAFCNMHERLPLFWNLCGSSPREPWL